MMSDQEKLEAPVVSAVTLDADVVRITVEGAPNSADAVSRIFRKISDDNINVDIIVLNRETGAGGMDVGFTVGKGDLQAVQASLESLRQDPPFASMTVSVNQSLAKVSVVGVGMQGHAGVATRTFLALTDAGIDIRMVSTSEVKISCVVDAAEGQKAVDQLHRHFIEA